MPPEPRPQPIPDADSAPFWAACREHRLLAQRCDKCGRWRWPPRGVCPACHSWATTWQPLAETGHVQSFVVPHRAFSPAFADRVPYCVVHVAMDGTDGHVVLIANLVDTEWEAVRVGQQVQARFEDVTESSSLPVFVRFGAPS